MFNAAALDRELAKRSLWEFVQLAWSHFDPMPLVPSWHLEAICQDLEDVSFGRVKRLVINVPPSTGKSSLTGVCWPVWDWLHVQASRGWMYASYDSGVLSKESVKIFRLVQSSWFRERWGELLSEKAPGVSEFGVRGLGHRYNTSILGAATGRHCDIQCIDDPIKPKNAAGGALISRAILDTTWDVLANTFGSRHKDPATFARVLIMQRIHEDDPAGRALTSWPGVVHRRLPAFAELDNLDPKDVRTQEGEPLSPRFETESYVKLCSELTEDVVDTQYQQRPAAKLGAIIKAEWIDAYACSEDEARAVMGRRIQSWDFAFKDSPSSDWVAGGWWVAGWIGGRAHFFLSAPTYNRLTSFVECLAVLRDLKAKWPSSEALVEDKANGPAIENVLRQEQGYVGYIRLVNPNGSKTARAHATAPLWSQGRVHLCRGPHFDELKKTLTRFPNVRRDDEVDQVTQALLALDSTSLFAQAMNAV